MAYTTINKSADYFNPKLYTGNSGTQSIAVGFQSDLVWCKPRENTGWHFISDSVRGGTKVISSNADNAEFTRSNNIQSFTSTGYTLGADGTSNNNGDNIVSWNWKAGGTASSNTDGNVTSTVSVNTTAGFSIVKWDSTGTAGINIGHGLGQKPAMIMAKCLNQSGTSWPVYHQSLGATKYVSLQATTAATTSATRWNNSEPTTTTFQTGSSGDIGGSNRTMIAYCFAEKQGYSKFGKYTGNGNADGTFVYTGFKPAWVMVKRTDGGANYWEIRDNKREPNNAMYFRLFPNTNSAESQDANEKIDYLSNGFKLRNTTTGSNGSGNSYIYMAFAEAPLVGTNNVPCTAR